MELIRTPGPHVFVDAVDVPVLAPDDLHHLARVLRIRKGDPLTISDGNGRWRTCRFGADGYLDPTGDVQFVPASDRPATVAFSLVKGQKLELVVQKLTELGVDVIAPLRAERSVVVWDDDKIATHRARWHRIAREAAMQSRRVRLPDVDDVVDAIDWIRRPDVAIAHFDGAPIDGAVRSVAIGPEGGWSPAEVDAAESRTVSLGPTVLRSETAAIAAATLLSATAAS